MRNLAIDIETYSSTDLTKCGVYKYVEAKDFDVLMLSYSYDNGPVQTIDLMNCEKDEVMEIRKALVDPTILKTAWNANFERTCLARAFYLVLPPEQWECSMVRAGMLGLPMSLEACAKVLKLEQQKDTAGKALIRYFSVPCKPTKTNGMRTRNLPQHDQVKWEQYLSYNNQDVVTELAIREKIKFFPVPEKEKLLWNLDQKINDTGILLDPELVKAAINMDEENKAKLTKQAIGLTGLENPNSAAQLKSWLTEATGDTVTSLTKTAIPELLEATDCETVTEVLELRQEMAKTSVKKYEAMAKAICSDSRVRGLLQFYGANRTGRWAGRLVQVQNLPQNHLPDLDMARAFVKAGDAELVEMLFGSIPDTLSQLIRTAFVAPENHRLIVADFSAIEARVIAWLAGEKWRMDVFNTHGKIYEASAAQMFKVPLESVTKGSPLRQKGKVAELALGYQGGPGALISMGALNMGVKEEELPMLVKMWRNANRAIVKLWNDVETAAIAAVEGEPSTIQHGIRFFMDKGFLIIMLPSGRMLFYVRPRLKANGFGGQSIAYEGMNQTTKQWGWQDTYGGKLVENIVQAIARDCLAEAMLRIDTAGYKIIMSVHDEIVIEAHNNFGSVDEVNMIMGMPISWAKGLPLKADGYETNYYKKD